MRHLFTILALCLLPLASFAQTKAVLKVPSTNALTENIVIPTGKTITIDSGGTFTCNGSASVGNLVATTINSIPISYGAGGTPTNLAIGYHAMDDTTSDTSNNTALGFCALDLLTTGGNNTAIGSNAANSITTGSGNTIVGFDALSGNATKNYNVAVGAYAGLFQADGATILAPDTSVYIGAQCRGLSNSDSNSIVLGYNGRGEGANSTVIGNTSTTSSHLYGTLNVGGGTAAGELRILEPSGSGTNYMAFKSQAMSANVTYTLPAADGTSGQVLSTNGSGTLSWATAAGSSGLTIGTTTITSGTSGRVLYDNAGVVGEIATTTGGNGTADSGKIPRLTAWGGIVLGKNDVIDGSIVTAALDFGNCVSIGVNSTGNGVYSELDGTGSSSFHAHVAAPATGNNTGFDADMTGGSGVNYLLSGLMRSTGIGIYIRDYNGGSELAKYGVLCSGSQEWYGASTTPTSGTNKIVMTPATPSGTTTITIPAQTGTMALTTANTFTATQRFQSGSNYWSINPAGAIQYYNNSVGVMTQINISEPFISNGAAFQLGSAGGISWQSTTRVDSGTSDLLLFRDAAATLEMGLDAASATAQAFKAHDGSGTDKAGANMSIGGGRSTGTGRGGDMILKTSLTSTTGSSANSYATREYHSAKPVDLTESTATLFCNIGVAASKFAGAYLVCTVTANDGTDYQALTSTVNVNAVNKAGTVTTTLTQVDGTTAASSGTLTATYTAVANGASVDIKCSAVSSLAQTVLRVKWSVLSLNSDGGDTALGTGSIVTPQ